MHPCAAGDTAWFERALQEDAFTCWFQPLFDLSTGVVFAHECLIRLDRGPQFRSGREIVDAAVARGQLRAFDAHARELAIREGSRQHEPGAYLFVNFFPSAIDDPDACVRSAVAALGRTSLRPLEIIFEALQADDAGHLRRICDFLRREGFGVALDVFPSIDLMDSLRPDFMKLDASQLSAALVEQARDLRINVIAKNVESAEDAARVQSLGIYLMQGWHFGPPAPRMRANTGAALAKLMEQLGGTLQSETLQLL